MLRITNLRATAIGSNSSVGHKPILKCLTLAIIAGSFMVGAATAKRAPPPNIPKQFHGEWREKLNHCYTDMDVPILTLDTHYVSEFESSGAVKSVRILGPNSIRVTALWTYSGEDGSEVVTRDYRLIKSGTQLAPGAPHTKALKRCPAKKKPK
jgi:hypothetical protein